MKFTVKVRAQGKVEYVVSDCNGGFSIEIPTGKKVDTETIRDFIEELDYMLDYKEKKAEVDK